MMGAKSEPAKPAGVQVAELVLHNTGGVDLFEDKAGFNPWQEENTRPAAPQADAIAAEEVVDLSAKMKADGTLD